MSSTFAAVLRALGQEETGQEGTGKAHQTSPSLPLTSAQDVKLTRATYQLFLNKTKTHKSIAAPSKSSRPKAQDLRPAPIKRKPDLSLGRTLDLEDQRLKLMPAQTNKELVFAHASGILPTQYAIMRNIMKELNVRMGWNKEEERGGFQFIDFAAGYGAAAW